jgi:hypothetical protein
VSLREPHTQILKRLAGGQHRQGGSLQVRRT